MSLKTIGAIAIPNAEGSEFDHAAFDPKSRRVFIAHTARDCVEVIDHDAGKHLATLPGFPGAAGAVADDGQILITNRGSASIALLDAGTLESRATYKTGGRPNGAVIVARLGLGWPTAGLIHSRARRRLDLGRQRASSPRASAEPARGCCGWQPTIARCIPTATRVVFATSPSTNSRRDSRRPIPFLAEAVRRR